MDDKTIRSVLDSVDSVLKAQGASQAQRANARRCGADWLKDFPGEGFVGQYHGESYLYGMLEAHCGIKITDSTSPEREYKKATEAIEGYSSMSVKKDLWKRLRTRGGRIEGD